MDVIIMLISLLLLAIPVLGPFVLMVVGLVKRTSADPLIKQEGTRLLQWGIIWLGAQVLIGYAVCSTMKFHLE